MKVLVACEYSGIVRTAFEKLGHEAWSCDLIQSEIPGNHYQGNVLDILNNGWDLMIAHPPCQYLSYAGIGYFNIEKYGEKAKERERKKEEAIKFFLTLWNAPIKKICLENPRGFPMKIIRPAQMIHPYYFGDSHKKLTCLWLKNLPLLNYSFGENLFGIPEAAPEPAPIYIDKKGKKRYFTDSISGFKKNAAKDRAKTFNGIAKAMAEQWGENNLKINQSSTITPNGLRVM